MSTEAVTCKHIQHGFIVGGVIDTYHHRYPDLNKIIATCQKEPSKEEYQLCLNTFPALLDIMVKKGFVPDTVFEEYQFPVDRDILGKVVRRTATISQEPRQRAKILTHYHQNAQREARQLEKNVDKIRKVAITKEKLLSKMKSNENCEKKLCEIMKTDTYNGNNALIEHFAIPSVPLLEAFIMARNLDLNKSKLPKKGKLSDAEAGNYTLIKLAFEHRYKRNLFLDEYNVLVE